MASEEFQSHERANLVPINQLENIKVAVRIRPFTEKEKQRNNRRIVDIEQNTVTLYSPKHGDVSLKRFTFDYSYWSHDGFKKDANGNNVPDRSHPNCDKYIGQEKVFEDLGQFLLVNALKGYNSALLAYGQTGSGKSYTVSGYGQNEGILPRFARALFEELNKKAKISSPPRDETSSSVVTPDDNNELNGKRESGDRYNSRYEIFFSMIEIYNEVVRDLLAKSHGDLVTHTTFARRGLKVREHPKHGFFVENLTSYPCVSKDEIERRIEEGQLNKSIAATSMNETSSRGHTIYEFKIKQYELRGPASPEETLISSVVQLVDLAGSERMAIHVTGQLGNESFIGSRSNSPFPRPNNEKAFSSRNMRSKMTTSASSASSSAQQPSSTSNNQQRFKESVSINQSLSALGNCIQVLSQYSQQLESSSFVRKPRPKIPYRDSVLTKLLNRCCLSGNSKVVIIATLSPADTNYDDTLSTLRFADRAKRIRTHATVNQMNRSEMVGTLQRENERLKQMVDGRVTRSDDSSQTSNFDDTENAMDNFTGSKIHNKAGNVDAMATPSRSRTTIRKPREDRQATRKGEKARIGLASSASNPSLVVKEQMKRLVSPASRKLQTISDGHKTVPKSRSMVHGFSSNRHGRGDIEDSGGDEFDDVDLNGVNTSDEVDLSNIKEGLISPDSDDSFSALADEELTNEEKIGIFNRLLSNSTTTSQIHQNSNRSPAKGKAQRPKKAYKARASMKQVSILSSSLKKSNPYLSNLNPDEQLTGIISYIIKDGESIMGKSNDCDVILHGPELRGQHAKITRVNETGTDSIDKTSTDQGKKDAATSRAVYLEPIFNIPGETMSEKNVALMVNGSPVTKKLRLKHCDRLLFGTNAYFVFIDNQSAGKSNDGTVADLDLVTFDMAQNEVLRKMMAEGKNEAMIKEIQDYTHRPGTGKLKHKQGNMKERASKESNSKMGNRQASRLTRSMTIHDRENSTGKREDEVEKSSINPANATVTNMESSSNNDGQANQDTSYRDQLMEDTYEYAMPVAEVNAVAKEMGIKVTYGLKILTGEEQIPEPAISNYSDSTNSDGFSSSDVGDAAESGSDRNVNDDRVTHLIRLDGLDIPPALYIKVHLDEYDLDFYWSKEKFQARRFKILELYGPWDVGGKSGLVEHLIDQSKILGDYLIDPFIDDPSSTFVLIGHAQITLQPISHLTDIKQSYDIVDLNDETVGSISIQAIPCHYEETSKNEQLKDPYRPYSDEDLSKNLLENPRDLLGKKLVFLLKIISCNNLPDKYANLFCQYNLVPEMPSIRTKVMREESLDREESQSEIMINHSHFICLGNVDQDILNFLEHGFLTIQVVGQYRLGENSNRSPTVISTIINSINKYKFKMEQQNSSNGMSYSSSAFYNSNTDSAKSNRGQSSGPLNSNSGASSVASTSATVNLFDQQNEDEDGINAMNGLSQENIIDMILTKRKLDRAENQLHYLKRTVNIAEHYNKKHIPVKTVKKLLSSFGHELDNGSLEDIAADVAVKGRITGNKQSGCTIQ